MCRTVTASAALATLLCTAPASADEPVSSSSTKPVLVLAAPQIAGTDVDDRAIAVVTAHLRSLDLDVRVVRTDAGALDPAGVRDGARKLIDSVKARGALWLDAGNENDLGLFAIAHDSGELYGRRVTLPRGKTAAALESLAGIAAAVAEELAAGRATGLTKVDVAPATPNNGDTETRPRTPDPAETSAAQADSTWEGGSPPSPRLRRDPPSNGDPQLAQRPMITSDARDTVAHGPTPWPELAFAASYVGGTFGDLPWQNGASLRASFAPVRGLYVGAGYDVVAPSHGNLFRGSFDLSRHPIFAGGGYRLGIGSGLDLQLGARATFDVAQRESSMDDHGPRAQGPGGPGGSDDRTHTLTGLVVSAAPVAEAFFLITDQLRMNAMIGVDIPFSYSAISGAPPQGPQGGPPPGPPRELATDSIRFIAGLGFEYGVVLPSSRKNTATASR